jgi:predicted nucleic acid-binding protein
MQKACLDAGILSIFFSKDCTSEVEALMENILAKKIEAFIVKPILSEVFFHLCQLRGKEEANQKILSFIKKYTPFLVDMNESLIIETGLLKCQHHTTLSYNDCMSIGYCLNEKIAFHTTEKLLKKIPHNTLQKLKVISYHFDE